MADVRIDEKLWASTMLPEGLIERWLVADGAKVCAGQAIVTVLIEESLHEISAPVDGQLTISARTNVLIEPGSIVGQVSPPQIALVAAGRVSSGQLGRVA